MKRRNLLRLEEGAARWQHEQTISMAPGTWLVEDRNSTLPRARHYLERYTRRPAAELEVRVKSTWMSRRFNSIWSRTAVTPIVYARIEQMPESRLDTQS